MQKIDTILMMEKNSPSKKKTSNGIIYMETMRGKTKEVKCRNQRCGDTFTARVADIKRGLFDDFHDYKDTVDKMPWHMAELECERCGKKFCI